MKWLVLEEGQNRLDDMNIHVTTHAEYLASLGFILLTHKIRFCYSTNTSNMKCNVKVKDNNTSPTCFRELDKH